MTRKKEKKLGQKKVAGHQEEVLMSNQVGQSEEILDDNGKPVESELKQRMVRCYKGGQVIEKHIKKSHLEFAWDRGWYLTKIHKHLIDAKCFGAYCRTIYDKSRQYGYDLENIASEFAKKDMRTYADLGEKKLLACIRAKKNGTKEWLDNNLEEIKSTKPEDIRNITGADRRSDTRVRYEAFTIVGIGKFILKIHKKQNFGTVFGLDTPDDKDSFQQLCESWMKARTGAEEIPADPEEGDADSRDSLPIASLMDLYTDGLEGRSVEMNNYGHGKEKILGRWARERTVPRVFYC